MFYQVAVYFFFCHYAFLLICAIHHLICCSLSLSYLPFVVSFSSPRLNSVCTIRNMSHLILTVICFLLCLSPPPRADIYHLHLSHLSYLLPPSTHVVFLCAPAFPHVPRITCNFTSLSLEPLESNVLGSFSSFVVSSMFVQKKRK